VKRKRGRPPKLPPEYYRDLYELLIVWLRVVDCGGELKELWLKKPAATISRMCRNIIDLGGVKWIDRDTGETVAEITNEGTLRTRVTDAVRMVREERGAWQRAKFTVTTVGTTGTGPDLQGAGGAMMLPTPSDFASRSTAELLRRTAFQIPKRKLHNK